jgi:type I restriction enzyme, S subunit
MDAQQFLTEFGPIASAPNGVQKLREMVLQLAVMGRLIEQSVEEGDGHSLLDQIRDLNSGAGRIRDVQLEELARVQVPGNWAIGCLGEVADIVRGVTFPGSAKSKVKSGDTVACLRTASIQNEIDWDDLIYISPSHVGREDQWVRPNDIAISMANSYELVGKVALVRQVPQKATFGGFIAVIRAKLIQPGFLLIALRSPGMQAAFRDSSSQTTNIANISLGRMRPLPFPLPPLAEQKRIVAKVDELMALCERLEALQNQRKSQRSVLTKELLGRLAQGDADDVQKCLQNLSHLVTDADQVPEIRKAILSLAVQGKLVPQHPADEESVASYPEMSVIPVANRNRILPKKWACATYRSLTTLVTSGSRGWKDYFAATGALFVRTQNIKTDELNLDDAAFVKLPEKVEGVRSQVQKDDILITITGANVTKAARVKSQFPEAYVSQHIALTRPRWSEMSEWIHLCFISHGAARGELERLAYGDKPGLNLNHIRGIQIPIPPRKEQNRILAKVDLLMVLCDTLEAKLRKASEVQEQLASSAIAALTGIQTQEKETMKAPKTELVARLKLGKKPSTKDHAPLASLLVRHNNELSPNALLQHSSLDIDGFYRQLKIEMNHGWIVQPEMPSMKVEERR